MSGPSKYAGMGANIHGGECGFRVWAPNARRVVVNGEAPGWTAGPVDLAPDGNGFWSVDVTGVIAGQRYKFSIDNVGGSPNNPGTADLSRVDAYARDVESSGAAARGIIVNPAFVWTPFVTPRFENFILYQAHVGSFAGFNDGIAVPSRTARFSDIAAKLGYVRDLGFNALALLPVGEYRGDIDTGYAPTNYFSPESAYGSPDDLRKLVDAAHRAGLSVIFDVVFNHASTRDNRYWEYDGMTFEGGIYFEGGGDTPWGRAPAHWKREVQDFFLDNARMWFREYNADGLRFDAVHRIQAESVRHIVWGVRQDFPDKYLIAEYDREVPHPIRDLGFHAVWGLADPYDFREAMNGDASLDRVEQHIGREGLDNQWNHVRYLLGSHDQISDDQDGKRFAARYFVELVGGRDDWHARAKARLGWALTVANPGTPMMFMGTEGHLGGYWSPVLDSNGEHRLDWQLVGDAIGAPMQRLVRDVNQVRWSNGALRSDGLAFPHHDPANRVLAIRRWNMDGNVVLVVVNAGDGQWEHFDYGVHLGGETGRWEEIFNSQSPQYGGWDGSGNVGHQPWVQADGNIYVNLPKWSVLLFRKI